MKDHISCIILAKDETESLKRCLDSVAQLGEAIIVDDFSSDRIDRLISRTREKLVHRKFDNLTDQRMFGAGQATKKWILFLDADECLTKSSLNEIERTVKQNMRNYYAIPRENIVLGKILKHGNWYPDYQLRLMKRDQVNFHPQSEEVGRLEIPLKHYSHRDIGEWGKKYWRATDILAKTRTKVDLSPLLKSLNDVKYRLVKGKGYKDGFIGVITILYLPVFELTIFLKLMAKKLWTV
ncbi:MAG: Glycosyl transferase family 2 [Candidatus Amesbacteria bacterium GW2011_GWB1_47_19]|nr:MAG: Glycosyl transferase family 2 [Candidatus Amesbacteria bacterium GW2011_GWA1_44_24]KKU31333.1 MAG: Glycosyl transferase family 2 [Candidatus Amesbacteria bacterium GW2011_GWC1_46_24]KKU67014.1 MAG: Glycosyl transferase family 2 [Candidatus Amesbacteria bacterium GW2011_GWB1_47_19]OGD04828.1 MAG: hypothetical protein A2379_04645 [Candidatus Amesbacteria bacterium RIFOXYB1_FULL_47_13]HBC72768.1 hypothetical protein [Candidatus Amesbacteria bacterium]